MTEGIYEKDVISAGTEPNIALDSARTLRLRTVEATRGVRHATLLIRAAAASLAHLVAHDVNQLVDAAEADQAAVAELLRMLVEAAVQDAVEAAQGVRDAAG